MKLAHNWWDILRYAWSIRFIALAALASGLEIAWPFLEGVLPIPQGVFAGVAFALTTTAFVARIVAQKDLPDA